MLNATKRWLQLLCCYVTHHKTLASSAILLCYIPQNLCFICYVAMWHTTKPLCHLLRYNSHYINVAIPTMLLCHTSKPNLSFYVVLVVLQLYEINIPGPFQVYKHIHCIKLCNLSFSPEVRTTQYYYLLPSEIKTKCSAALSSALMLIQSFTKEWHARAHTHTHTHTHTHNMISQANLAL